MESTSTDLGVYYEVNGYIDDLGSMTEVYSEAFEILKENL
jgi:hypothetical protein